MAPLTELDLGSDAVVSRIRERVTAALADDDDLANLQGEPPVEEASHREGVALDVPAATRDELKRFADLLRDYPARNGKYLRSRVICLSAAAHGARPGNAPQGNAHEGHALNDGTHEDGRLEDGAGEDAVLLVAAAIELFQAWVLIHDDIEDDSLTRRGSPALHRQVGMPVALNVGDALHVKMWRLLHGLFATRPGLASTVIAEFGAMIERTAQGQHLDLAYVESGRVVVSEEEYLDMVARKTAGYTVVSPLRLGALLAQRQPSAALSSAGRDLGIAFQIRDDVLNLQRRPRQTDGYGKEFAGDLYEGKRTLILAHLFRAADRRDATSAQAILARPRRERTAEDVDVLLELIDRHGSLDYAQGVADELARRGLQRLEDALADLPVPSAAERLLDLLADVAKRRS